MCTVVLTFRPGHAWPLCLAANRDEMVDRAWDVPAAYWPELPGVIAGRDRTAGGTWMGLNRHGVVAAVLNRPGSLGPAAGKRSRGELPLLALAHPTAADAVAALREQNAGGWRGFNLVVADRESAFFLRGAGQGAPGVMALPPGVSMITAHDPNDPASPRVARHLPRFQKEPGPSPEDWTVWREILSDRSGDAGEQINVLPRAGFGTVCSSFVALPVEGAPVEGVPVEGAPVEGAPVEGAPVWLFASGPPHHAAFTPVRMAAAGASRPCSRR